MRKKYFIGLSVLVFIVGFIMISPNYGGGGATAPVSTVSPSTVPETSWAKSTRPPTSSTLDGFDMVNCSMACQNFGYVWGECMEDPKYCRQRGMNYVKKGNSYCDKTSEGFDMFCCCSENPYVPPNMSTYLRPGAELDEVELELLESLVSDIVNSRRALAGLSPLESDLELSNIARAHSRDMAEKGFFSHVGSNGWHPRQRGDERGYPCVREVLGGVRVGIGENLAKNHLYRRTVLTPVEGGMRRTYVFKTLDELASDIVETWSESPEHNLNMMDEGWMRQGIGIASTDEFEILVTQNMC